MSFKQYLTNNTIPMSDLHMGLQMVNLNEIKSNIKINWKKSEDWEGNFEINKKHYKISINNLNAYIDSNNFYIMDVTNNGDHERIDNPDSLKVSSAIISSIKEFIKSKKEVGLFFSAEDEKNRKKSYKYFSTMLGKQLGYRGQLMEIDKIYYFTLYHPKLEKEFNKYKDSIILYKGNI